MFTEKKKKKPWNIQGRGKALKDFVISRQRDKGKGKGNQKRETRRGLEARDCGVQRTFKNWMYYILI